MSKAKKLFYCKNCGSESPKWLCQCSSCKEWNSIVEEVIEKNDKYNILGILYNICLLKKI